MDEEEGDEEGDEEVDEEGDEEEEEDWEEEYVAEISYKDHPELTVEMANYAKVFGKENITSRWELCRVT